MSKMTREEVLAKKRDRYARAGKEPKSKIIAQLVELFGYHPKSAIRALRPRVVSAAPFVRGRPREYDPDQLLPPLKTIWLAALQPCGERLKACLPEWLPAHEADQRRPDSDVREARRAASRAPLDRLLIPARVAHRRRATTRPGRLLRQSIPIRTEWTENTAGFLELDTVAWCGGALDDRHGWMFSGVDIHTTWSVLRGLPNRSEARVGGQMSDVEARRPFALRGVDSDNGGEFINHQLVKYPAGRTPPVAFPRSRPYRKNDQAHIEQKNFTNVRQWFGYERYEHPEVWPLVNTLCRGALDQLLNYFLPTMKLEKKERVGSKTVRHYGVTQTPLARVLACAEVAAETKQRLKPERAALNPLAVRREVDRQMKVIEAWRRNTAA